MAKLVFKKDEKKGFYRVYNTGNTYVGRTWRNSEGKWKAELRGQGNLKGGSSSRNLAGLRLMTEYDLLG